MAPDSLDRLRSALADRYRIERELGAGGMATVYLAADLKHHRQVAIKVLRPELAAVLGAERFVQEITTTAQLQHPHILPLFDSGQADGFLYYVMPYVEGETLRTKLDREKQLGVEEAVKIATEVADALDYAHRHGVIHRDIKPENILLHDGRPMVADFGIALAVSAAAGGRMTETGLSLGTPHYMSPEQATAEKEITARSDVYSLASVLYEMLAGQPPHVGGSAQQIIMKIIAEPVAVVTSLRKSVPPNVAAALTKALEKLPADRFASATEFVGALGNPAFGTGVMTSARAVAAVRGRARLLRLAPWAVAAAAAVVAAVALLRHGPATPVERYGLALPSAQTPLPLPATPSPDGSSILYVGPVPGQRAETIYQLWLKRRDSYEATPVPGTVGAWNATFSPDGRWIAFVQDAHVLKVAVSGGSPVTLADSAAPRQPGIAWLDDGTIVYVELGGHALRRVSENGGRASVVTRGDTLVAEPSPLPGGRGVLFAQCRDGGCSAVDVRALDFRTGQSRVLLTGAEQPEYLPTGHVLYVRQGDGSAFVVPFDLGSLSVRGQPVSVLDSVSVAPGYALIAVSQGGTMVVRRGGAVGGAGAGRYELVWMDRAGAVQPIDMNGPVQVDPGSNNAGWSLSPDGRRLAIGLVTPAGEDIWVKQLPDGPVSRVTFDSAQDFRPRWLRDGRHLTYVSVRVAAVELHEINADGTGGDTVIARNPDGLFEGAISPDGQWIVARIRGGLGHQGRDIIGYRRGDTTAVLLVASAAFDENAFRLSPDGRWIAYESDETGRREVYVRPFPNTGGGKWQASTDGGYAPLWAPSGRELFFVDAQRRMTVVPFTPGPEPRFGERRVLFALTPETYLAENDYYTPYHISPEGRRFVMARRIDADRTAAEPLIVVDNWFTELSQRLRHR
jgi:Tol biopolymer transport system component